MAETSIAYDLDSFYYDDKFTEEDYPYEHYLNHDLYDDAYFREAELRESFSLYSRYHGKHFEQQHHHQPKKMSTTVEHYLRSNPALYEEPVQRRRQMYPREHHVEASGHLYGHFGHGTHHVHRPMPPRDPRHPQYHPRHLRQVHPPQAQPQPQQSRSGIGSVKKFRKKTNKHSEKGDPHRSNSRKSNRKNDQYFKQAAHYTTRIRIHGDSWKESSEGFVGLVGKGGSKIGIYRTDKIDPLLPINNRHTDEKATAMASSSFNTYHAGAFWRLFGVEINNVQDFRQTVGDRIVGFAVRPDGDVVVKTISFTANAAVNIVKVLDILESMRKNGYRSRSVEELTTEGTIQAIVEQWMDGNKVIEMSL